MVRISIPTLPVRPPRPPTALTLLPSSEAGAHLGRFLQRGEGRTLVVTGAGVSVDSGIRAYRGDKGAYSNPNYQPIFYGELVENSPRGEMFRKRYWARSFLGYPPVRAAQPNPTHIYIAALQTLGLAPGLITQNVDNLHRKALARVRAALDGAPRDFWTNPEAVEAAARIHSGRVEPLSPTPILELHGTLVKTHCLQHLHEGSRDAWQDMLAEGNPVWGEALREMEDGRGPRTNPDGDVELPGADYASFAVPECPVCAAQDVHGSIVKPDVIFFGETLPAEVKDESNRLVDTASSLLVLGTTLATYSAFRLVKAAHEQGKPVLVISLGPSRADDLPNVEKMEREAGPVLRAFLDQYFGKNSSPEIDAVKTVLDSGTIKRPTEAYTRPAAPLDT